MTAGRSPRGLLLLIGAAVAAASVCLVTAAVAAAMMPVPSLLLLVGCLSLLLAGVRFHLPIRLGAQRVELSWSEAGFMLAFAVAPAPWVVLLTPVAVGLSLAQRRFAPVKTVYNSASYTAAAGSAAAVLTATGVSRPLAGSELLVLTVAGAAAGLITYLAVAAVVAVVQDVPLLATWRESAGLQALTLAGNLGLAVGVLVLARYQLWAV